MTCLCRRDRFTPLSNSGQPQIGDTMTTRRLAIANGELDQDYAYLHVYNRDDKSDRGAKCFLDFRSGHNLTGDEERSLCNRIRGAMALLDEIASTVPWDPAESDPAVLPEVFANRIIQRARELRAL